MKNDEMKNAPLAGTLLRGSVPTMPRCRRFYCTTRVKLPLLVVPPLTALTITLYVPVGVPGLGGGPWLLPPPLQPGTATISPSSSKTKSPRARRRFGTLMSTMEKIKPTPDIHCARK
jgi:hypothetical protein